MARNPSTEVAIRTKDIKVPYILKKAIVRPVILGVRKAVLETGDILFTDFGRFYVEAKQVSKGVGSREKKAKVVIRFKPSKNFVKEVAARWNEPLKVRVIPADSQPESASSAGGEGSAGSSAEEGSAPAGSSST